MKISSIITATAFVGLSQAWYLHFYNLKNGDVQHKVITSGHSRGSCNNIRSDYKYVTNEIFFTGVTDYYADAHSYTAYTSADCKGSSYTGVNGWQKPNKTFKSYRVK